MSSANHAFGTASTGQSFPNPFAGALEGLRNEQRRRGADDISASSSLPVNVETPSEEQPRREATVPSSNANGGGGGNTMQGGFAPDVFLRQPAFGGSWVPFTPPPTNSVRFLRPVPVNARKVTPGEPCQHAKLFVTQPYGDQHLLTYCNMCKEVVTAAFHCAEGCRVDICERCANVMTTNAILTTNQTILEKLAEMTSSRPMMRCMGMPGMGGMAAAGKPVIYVYSGDGGVAIDATVTLDLSRFKDKRNLVLVPPPTEACVEEDIFQWKVTTLPKTDGMLQVVSDKYGRKTIPSIFYDFKANIVGTDFSSLFVVNTVEDVQPRLQWFADRYGLSDRESHEFLTYWAPRVVEHIEGINHRREGLSGGDIKVVVGDLSRWYTFAAPLRIDALSDDLPLRRLFIGLGVANVARLSASASDHPHLWCNDKQPPALDRSRPLAIEWGGADLDFELQL